jgi:tyrosine-protein kinase Etk/Wzc
MSQTSRSEEINLTDLFKRFIGAWKWFLGVTIFMLLLAFLTTQYYFPPYPVKSDVQIMVPESKGEQTDDLIYGGSKKSLNQIAVDEAVVLRAYPSMLKVMDDLNFHVSYYIDKFFGDVEIYKNVPFKVTLNKKDSKFIPYDQKFSIQMLPESKFHVVAKLQNEDTDEELEIDTIYPSGEWITTNMATFKIEINSKQIDTTAYVFKFVDINSYVFTIDANLTIEPKDKVSSVLELTYNTNCPEKGINFLNNLMDIYLNTKLLDKNELAQNSLGYINKELNGVSDSLEVAEKELERFLVKNKISTVSNEAERVSQLLENLDNEKSELSVKSRYFTYLRDYLTDNQNAEKLISPSAFGITDPVLNDLTKDLSSLQGQKNALISQGKTKNPDYTSISDKIETLKSNLLDNVNNFNTTNSIKLSDIESRIGNANSTISKLPTSEKMLVKIQRNVTLSQNLYMLLQEKKSQAETILQSNKPDSKVVDPAHKASNDPSFPVEIFYPINFILALIGVSITILAKDFLSNKVKTKRNITNKLQIPFAGNIPEEKSKKFSLLTVAPQMGIMESARIILYNTSKINLQSNKVVSVNSAIPSEGKSFCSSLLAIASAYSRKKTLLINADLRMPTIHEQFNIQASPGLTDYLEGHEQLDNIIKKSSIENLDIIVSGTRSINPAALLDSSSFKELIESVKKNYDRVIIDTAPLTLVADAFFVTPLADVNLIVVRKNLSPINKLGNIQDDIEGGKIPNAAFIYNGTDVEKSYGYYQVDTKKKLATA